MKRYLTPDNTAMLVRIAVLSMFVFGAADFSPALAATLSRGGDVGPTLSAAWSMIGRLCNIGEWWPSQGPARIDKESERPSTAFIAEGSRR